MNQQQQISPLALYDKMQEINQLRDQQQIAQNMTQTNGWGGGAGILGAILGGYMSGKTGRDANAAETDYQKQAFMMEQEQSRRAAEQAQMAAEQKRQADLQALIPILGEEKALAAVQAGVDPKTFMELDNKAADRDFKMTLQNDQQAFTSQQTADQRAYEAVNQKPDFSMGDKLRKEFQSLQPVKDFDEVNASMQKVVSSAQNPSAATDIALITGFMKMNDPGSTVREGEFATAASAGSANERFVGLYNSLLSGERLTPEQRAKFVDSAGRLYNAHSQQYSALKNQYGELAQRQGLNPDEIFIKRDVLDWQSQQPKKDISQMSLEELKALEAEAMKGQ